MTGCQHLTHTWLFPCVWLLTLHSVGSTYSDPRSPGCALAGYGYPWDPNYHVDPRFHPLTSCQLNPATGAAWFPGETPYLQLNICNPAGETETFVFSADMFASWSACLNFDNTEWCQVTAHDTNVFNVTRGGSHYMSGAFLCHQPTSDTMLCQRRLLGDSGCDIAMFGNAYQYAPLVCLAWNGSQTAVTARCPADSGLCLGYNASARSCSPAAAKAGSVADPSGLPRDTVIGVAVTCVLVVALLVALITVYLIRRRRQHPPASSQSSVQSMHSPKTNTGIRPQLHAHSSRRKSIAGSANSHFTNGDHWPGSKGNAYTSHSHVSGSQDQASTVDDHTYASIDVSLAANTEYMALDESTKYSHTYKAVVINDPNLRPPMPLPLHVTDQPLPYYSAAEARGVMSAYGDGETASGQYVDLLEDNTYPDLAVSGGYLVPVSLSSYLQETSQQPRLAVSLVSDHRTPQPARDRQRPVY